MNFFVIGAIISLTIVNKFSENNIPLTNITQNNTTKEVGEDVALIDITFDRWGQNIYNENEILFDFWIKNYGYVEGKDISVSCVVVDENDNRIFWVKKPVRNVASTSYNYEEISAIVNDNTLKRIIGKNLTGYCAVVNCSNCEILDKRIYKELYEKYFNY